MDKDQEKVEVKWTTAGSPTHSTGDTIYYDQARKGAEVYKKGDFIYVRGSSTSPWIAQIANFGLSKAKGNQLNVRCCWFLRQEDIFDDLAHKDPQEVYMGLSIDDNIVQTIIGKTRVLSKADYDALVKGQSHVDKDVYFCQKKCLDPIEKEFEPLNLEEHSFGNLQSENAHGSTKKRSKDTSVSEDDAHDSKKLKKNLVAFMKKQIDNWVKEMNELNDERAEQLKEDIDFRLSKLK